MNIDFINHIVAAITGFIFTGLFAYCVIKCPKRRDKIGSYIFFVVFIILSIWCLVIIL